MKKKSFKALPKSFCKKEKPKERKDAANDISGKIRRQQHNS